MLVKFNKCFAKTLRLLNHRYLSYRVNIILEVDQKEFYIVNLLHLELY